MRKNALLLAATLCFLLPLLHAQETVDTAMMQRIKDEEANHSQVASIAHNLTDVIGPRLTNSPGYRHAVSWAVDQLKSWGLKAAPEAWGQFGKGWSNERCYIAMKAPYYHNIIGYAKAWSGSTNGLVSSKILLLDDLDSATIKANADKIKGKIVMARLPKEAGNPLEMEPSPYGARFAAGMLDTLPDTYMIPDSMVNTYVDGARKYYGRRKNLLSAGALGIVNLSWGTPDGTVMTALSTPGYMKEYETLLPEVALSPEDFLRLQRLAEDKDGVELEMDVKNNWLTDDLTGYNVIGEIQGTDANLEGQVVMLGGHLDSWASGTGATDNAAGCIVMMEAVRILKTLGIQPRRTIRIALWGGEEQGLLGSIGYVKKHYGNPAYMKLLPEQKKISAYFNLDNGTGKIRGVFLQNNAAVKPIFESWLKPFAGMGATGLTISNTGETDHFSFDAVGIPGFQFIQDPLEYEQRTHHTNMDVYDHLEIDDLKQAATIVAAFIYNAAMRNEMMPRKPLPAPKRFLFDTPVPF